MPTNKHYNEALKEIGRIKQFTVILLTHRARYYDLFQYALYRIQQAGHQSLDQALVTLMTQDQESARWAGRVQCFIFFPYLQIYRRISH